MSERKWIEVETDCAGPGPWIIVAPITPRGDAQAPVAVDRCVLRDAPPDDLIADLERRLRDAPDDEQLRRERDATRQDRDTCRRDAERAERERDEWRESARVYERQMQTHRDRVAELEESRSRSEKTVARFRRWLKRVQDERDEARREAEELRRTSAEDIDHLQLQIEALREERDEARERVAGLSQGQQRLREECSRFRENLSEARAQRDEARREAEELRERIREMTGTQGQLAHQCNAYERDANTARSKAEELRAENERLRAAGADVRNKLKLALRTESRPPEDDAYAVAAWDEVAGPVANPDQPAPQTKYKPDDVVDVGWNEPVRLLGFRRLDAHDQCEHWDTDFGHFVMRDVDLLERDGVPTDAGLRRLAEKAGFDFEVGEMDAEPDGFCIIKTYARRYVNIDMDANNDDRRALAAALREMGGA